MNKKLCILLVLAVLCSSVFAGKENNKSKEKPDKSKEKSGESKESSNESKSKEDSSESSSKEKGAPTTTVIAEITESTTEAATEAVTEPAGTEVTTEAAAAEPTETELKALCKGAIVDMKPYPGDCSKFVICVLGRASVQGCGKLQVFNSEIKFCTFGNPSEC